MLKKILFFVLIGGFLALIGPDKPRAETIFYGGGQMLVKGGSTDEIGGGTVVAIGQRISKKLIVWGSIDGFKTGEGVGVDNGFVGFSLLTDDLILPLRSGLFLTVEGGIGKVEDEKVGFANLTNAGFYFDLSESARLWVGGGYSATGGVDVYSIETGLSMVIDWK